MRKRKHLRLEGENIVSDTDIAACFEVFFLSFQIFSQPRNQRNENKYDK